MEILEWVRFLLGTGLLLVGLGIFLLQVFGVFKFKHVLSRMHAAAMGDTLGIGISLTGLILLSGFNFTSLKMALIIVFQPEIRRMLEQIGHSHIISLDMFRKRSSNEERRLQTSRAIAAVCDAAEQMSAGRVGALIVFERKSNLAEIMGTGTTVNADPTTELLNTIFYEGTLLHDGATIIRDGRIAAAGCVLPLSANLEISKEMGTRHRAALGMSENSDAVVVVVSEESGIVSLAKNGVLIRRLDRAALYKILSDDLLPLIEPTEKEKSRLARSAKNTANNTKEKLITRSKKAKPADDAAAAVPAGNAGEEKR